MNSLLISYSCGAYESLHQGANLTYKCQEQRALVAESCIAGGGVKRPDVVNMLQAPAAVTRSRLKKRVSHPPPLRSCTLIHTERNPVRPGLTSHGLHAPTNVNPMCPGLLKLAVN